MKIIFENEEERKCLEHILFDWICFCVEDPLGCEPVCRDETSPGCADCIKKYIKKQVSNNEFHFSTFGGEKYLEKTDINDIIKYASAGENYKDKVIEYLKSNPNVTVSDVTKFVIKQDDFIKETKLTSRKTDKNDGI